MTLALFVNLVNPVAPGGLLFVKFTTDWSVIQSNCSVISQTAAAGSLGLSCGVVAPGN